MPPHPHHHPVSLFKHQVHHSLGQLAICCFGMAPLPLWPTLIQCVQKWCRLYPAQSCGAKVQIRGFATGISMDCRSRPHLTRRLRSFTIRPNKQLPHKQPRWVMERLSTIHSWIRRSAPPLATVIWCPQVVAAATGHPWATMWLNGLGRRGLRSPRYKMPSWQSQAAPTPAVS